jgi:hypothetical protein
MSQDASNDRYFCYLPASFVECALGRTQVLTADLSICILTIKINLEREANVSSCACSEYPLPSPVWELTPSVAVHVLVET